MSETEFIGMLVLALASLLGLFKLVMQPLIKAMTDLTKNITTLNLSVENLQGEFEGMKKQLNENAEHSRDSRRKLWEHNEVQDRKIEDHEKRIYLIEKTKDLNHHQREGE